MPATCTVAVVLFSRLLLVAYARSGAYASRGGARTVFAQGAGRGNPRVRAAAAKRFVLCPRRREHARAMACCGMNMSRGWFAAART